MMLAPCAQATAESIREALDSLQRLKVSKWNYSESDVIKSCNDWTECPLLAVNSTGHCNTARSLSAGVSNPKVSRGR
jgi:hypothetical protein